MRQANWTTAECRRVLDELAELGALNLTFSGGEPLLRRDFFTIATYARDLHFLLRLFTNGSLISPAVADRIAALHPYAVEMSVYGIDAATHDTITGRPGAFARTTRAFNLLRDRGVRTVMKTPLMRENIRQFPELVALAASFGATFRYDLTITPKLSGDPAPLRHRLSFADLLWFFRTVAPPTAPDGPLTDACRTCAVGASALAIDPAGNVLPCLEVRRPAGNVRTTPLREIWTNAPVWAEVRGLTVGALPVCRSCSIRHLCRRCHGLARQESGDIHAPSTANCIQALARWQVLAEQGHPAATGVPIPAQLVELFESLNGSTAPDQPKSFSVSISHSA